MASKEHPVDQEIVMVEVSEDSVYRVSASSGITRIEACTKSGMHADIPYVRIWRGDTCLAELCQHNILALHFGENKA